MFGQFMLVSIKCIQPVQFDSVHATKFIFPSVFLVDSSDKIRLLVSFVGGVLGCGDTPVNVVSLLVSFRGRGARLWRHPG